MTDRKASPNTLPWPPMILVGTIIMAWLVGSALPLPLPAWLSPLGLALIIAALAIDGMAMVTMNRSKTTILPNKGTKNLVTHGVFSVSRNPIYVANIIIIVGYSLWTSNLWAIIAGPLAAYAMQELAIKREEAHLRANFGAEFDAYSRKTRRWL